MKYWFNRYRKKLEFYNQLIYIIKIKLEYYWRLLSLFSKYICRKYDIK